MRVFIVALLLLAATGTPWSKTVKQLDEYSAAMNRLGRFNGVVLVARGDDVFRSAYGLANFAANTPMRVDAQFEIASISKMFTAAAILKLRDAGKLRLSDSLCAHLTACPSAWRPVTIDETLHHRSGIPDYEAAFFKTPSYDAFIAQPNVAERALTWAAGQPLDFTPGSKFHYSNTGYLALAQVVERASGTTFPDYLHRTLLDPAGMRDTGINGVDPAPRLANGYTVDVTLPQRIAGFSYANVSPKPAASYGFSRAEGDAALFSTAGDLLKWAHVMQGRGPAIFSERERAEIFTSVDGYGDGWNIDSAFGSRRYRHTGELPGYLSSLTLFPDTGTIVVTLNNVDVPIAAFNRDVQAIAMNAPFDMPFSGTVVTISPEAKARVAGGYAMAGGQTLCVKGDAPMVLASVKDRFEAGLLPLSPTRFYMPLSSGIVTFALGSDGRASGVNMRYEGEDHPGSRKPDADCPAGQRAP